MKKLSLWYLGTLSLGILLTAPSMAGASTSATANGAVSNEIGIGVTADGGYHDTRASSDNWNYSPSSSSIMQTHDGDIYGTLPYAGRPYGPMHGSNHLLTPRKDRKNLRPGLEIINFGMPGAFTAQNFLAFKAGIIKSRGQGFWDKLVGEYTTGSLTLFINPISLPVVTATKSLTKGDLQGLVPGRDYIRHGEYQLDAGTEEVMRQFLLPIIINRARENRIPVVILEDDIVFRAGTSKKVNGSGWAIGFGFSAKLNGAPTVGGLGYGKANTEESFSEKIYAGSSVAFIAPTSDRFWQVVERNRAIRFGSVEKQDKLTLALEQCPLPGLNNARIRYARAKKAMGERKIVAARDDATIGIKDLEKENGAEADQLRRKLHAIAAEAWQYLGDQAVSRGQNSLSFYDNARSHRAKVVEK